MNVFMRAFALLTSREKRFVILSIVFRVVLVAFDLGGIFLIGVVMALLSGTVISPSSPVNLALIWLANHGISNGYTAFLAVAVLFFIVKGLLSVFINFITADYLARLEARKATQTFRGILNSPITAVESLGRQNLLHGLTDSVHVAFFETLNVSTAMIGELALLITISIYLLATDWALFIGVAVFFGLVGLFLQRVVGTVAHRTAEETLRNNLDAQGAVLGAAENFRQVFTMRKQENFVRKFSVVRTVNARKRATYSTITTLPRYTMEIAVMIGVGLLVMQRAAVGPNTVTTTTIAIFLAGIFRIVASMIPIQNGFNSLKQIGIQGNQSFELAEKYLPLGEHYREENSPGGDRNPPSVEFLNVSFSYNLETPVLSNVNVSVKPGEYVALVGASGAGKSTFADLALGLRLPDTGVVRIDGLSPDEFADVNQGAIAYVPQSIAIIPGTLEENITLGLDPQNVDPILLERAIHVANLREYVQSLPDGLKTRIGDEYGNLSGGQAQRVGLARAIYCDPKLLILDEVTSALDRATERDISQALVSMKGAITLIVIAHREETIRAADRRIEFSNGSVAVV